MTQFAMLTTVGLISNNSSRHYLTSNNSYLLLLVTAGRRRLIPPVRSNNWNRYYELADDRVGVKKVKKMRVMTA